MHSTVVSVPSGVNLGLAGSIVRRRRTVASALKPEQDQKSDPKLVQAARTYREGVRSMMHTAELLMRTERNKLHQLVKPPVLSLARFRLQFYKFSCTK